MIAIPNGPILLSAEIFILGLLLVLDVGLLVDFLRFIWRKSQRPVTGLKAFLFFKATTVPILLGAMKGFYSFLRKDESFLNKIKPAPDVVVTGTTHHSER